MGVAHSISSSVGTLVKDMGPTHILSSNIHKTWILFKYIKGKSPSCCESFQTSPCTDDRGDRTFADPGSM